MTIHVVFLTDETSLQRYWADAEPLLEKCVIKAVHGEYNSEDIAELVRRDRAIVILTYIDGKPSIALAIEWVLYPRLKVANVLALGGSQLMLNADSYWDKVKRVLKSAGMQYVQCACSPAMARMLSSKLGFEETYREMRLKL